MHENSRVIRPGLKTPTPPTTTKQFRLDADDFSFICVGGSSVGGYETKHLIQLDFSVTNVLPFQHQRKKNPQLSVLLLFKTYSVIN